MSLDSRTEENKLSNSENTFRPNREKSLSPKPFKNRCLSKLGYNELMKNSTIKKNHFNQNFGFSSSDRIQNSCPNESIINIRQIKVIRKIYDLNNFNKTSEIYICSTKNSVKVVAKIYNLYEGIFNIAKKEKEIYEELSGNNAFLNFYGSFTNNKKYYIILEKCPMSLKNYISNKNFVMDEDQSKIFVQKLLEGFDLLLNKNIVHMNINPNHILITKDYLPKIISFKSSYRTPGPNLPTRMVPKPTSNYTAPEIANKTCLPNESLSYDIVKADCFSVGIILLEFFRKKKTSGLNLTHRKSKLHKSIKKIEYKWSKTILKELLKINPTSRSCIRDVLLTFNTLTRESIN